jgi:hypothetical protein
MAGLTSHIGWSRRTPHMVEVAKSLEGTAEPPCSLAMATLPMQSLASTQRVPHVRRSGASMQRAPGLDVAWAPEQDLEHPEWVRWGRRLGATSRVSNWWVGDWLQYGASKWGEKYSEAARITGYDVKTLRNIAYIAKRFDLSRRRDKLTWSHHAEVAQLEPDEQDRWLDRAFADQLSVADLRTELRSAMRTPKLAGNDGGQSATSDAASSPSVTCPHCGKTIHLELDGGSPLVAAA